MTRFALKSAVAWRLLFLLPIAAALLLSGCDRPPPEKVEIVRPVLALRVGPVDALEGRTLSGHAKAANEVTLAFRVGGKVVERRVDVGDTVAAGDVLALLDPAPYRAEVERLRAELERARAKLVNAEEQYQRVMTLVEKGHYAKAKGDQALAERDIARAEVQALEATLQKAELELSYTQLKAPFPGRVVAVYVERFEDVRPQQPVLRVLDNRRIEFVVDVPDTLIAYVPYVEEAAVVFDPYPEVELKATVKEIGTEASPTTGTYPVTFIMDQPADVEILPGMSGTIRATRMREFDLTPRIILPPSAIFADPADRRRTLVWVVDEATGTVKTREIRLGRPTAAGVTVLDGLENGEWVVVAGVHSLEPGRRVRILDVAGEG